MTLLCWSTQSFKLGTNYDDVLWKYFVRDDWYRIPIVDEDEILNTLIKDYMKKDLTNC